MKKLNILGAILLTSFIASCSTAPSTHTKSMAHDESASVAVLPFDNMSGSPDNEIFSDGLTESLRQMLAQVPDLKVAPRNESTAFEGQLDSLREIAEALDVSYILEGSVRKSGDRVRISAQLVSADNGFHVWSETYDRTVEDVLSAQKTIVNQVSGAVLSTQR